MRTLYVDSVGGLAGDMFLGAALDAGFATLEELQDVGSRWLPERVALSSSEVTRGGMRARTFGVQVLSAPQGGHRHRHLGDVERLLDRCPIPPPAIAAAKEMFRQLAEAEAKVHGAPLEHVHFHEVGATDSLVDFAFAALVLDRLAARVVASPAVVGRGRIAMQHGFWPVPPPGTAELLRAGGVPTRSLPPDFPWENAELTTPTGVCLIRRAERFGDLPAGRLAAVGMGAGSLDVPGYPNVTRLVLLEEAAGAARVAPAPAMRAVPERFDGDTVTVLETWLDDLPPNLLAIATDEMLGAGALDVAVSSATFKKGRVGHRVEVLAPPERAEEIAAILLGRTTAIGLRVRESVRWKLYREEARTEDGLRAKLVRDGGGRIARLAPETDELAEKAKRGGPAPMLGWRVEDRREDR